VCGASGEWRDWADLFTEDAVYLEHSFGEFHGREEIYEWIAATMAEWPNKAMTSFPHAWCVCDEERGWWICRIENRFRIPVTDRCTRRTTHRAALRRRHEVLLRGGRLQPGQLRPRGHLAGRLPANGRPE
jgi:hypothetical protein